MCRPQQQQLIMMANTGISRQHDHGRSDERSWPVYSSLQGYQRAAAIIMSVAHGDSMRYVALSSALPICAGMLSTLPHC
jgi:hypothetical protein